MSQWPHASTQRMLRTGASGLLSGVVDVVVLIVLVEALATPVGVGAFLSAGAGAVFNFLVNKFWAFQDPARIAPRQVAAFAFVALCTAALVALSVHVLAAILGLPYLVAKCVASALAFVAWSHPAQARLVFPACSPAASQSMC